jgi:hypothetical protein
MMSNIFTNDPCDIIKYSPYLHFIQDINIFRAPESPNDGNRNLVQLKLIFYEVSGLQTLRTLASVKVELPFPQGKLIY